MWQPEELLRQQKPGFRTRRKLLRSENTGVSYRKGMAVVAGGEGALHESGDPDQLSTTQTSPRSAVPKLVNPTCLLCLPFTCFLTIAVVTHPSSVPVHASRKYRHYRSGSRH